MCRQSIYETNPKMEHTVASEQAVILENVEHSTHLTENKDTRALRLHVLEELVQNDHLARILNQMLVSGVGWPGFCPIEEVGVASDLTQLHDDVHEPRFALLLAGQT